MTLFRDAGVASTLPLALVVLVSCFALHAAVPIHEGDRQVLRNWLSCARSIVLLMSFLDLFGNRTWQNVSDLYRFNFSATVCGDLVRKRNAAQSACVSCDAATGRILRLFVFGFHVREIPIYFDVAVGFCQSRRC